MSCISHFWNQNTGKAIDRNLHLHIGIAVRNVVDAVMSCMCHSFSDSLIWLFTVSIALVSVLSAVGICERCRMESGGVYFLVSHVLGSKFGGALGLLYVFGQVSIMADMSKSLAFV